MKHQFLVLLASIALSSFAEAQKYIGTPAQDLFDQASFYLEFNYNGFSSSNLERLVAKYQAQIDEACAPQAQTCPFDVARRPVASMIQELQDPHSYFIPADIAQQFSGQIGGGRLGFSQSRVIHCQTAKCGRQSCDRCAKRRSCWQGRVTARR